MYTNGKHPPNSLWENHVVNPNPSLCLACIVLMNWPHLLRPGSLLTALPLFTMLQPSCFLLCSSNSSCCSTLPGPAPVLTWYLDLERFSFLGLAAHPKGSLSEALYLKQAPPLSTQSPGHDPICFLHRPAVIWNWVNFLPFVCPLPSPQKVSSVRIFLSCSPYTAPASLPGTV